MGEKNHGGDKNENAECAGAQSEARVADVAARLAESEHNKSESGRKKATALGAELEREKTQLEHAFAAWERAIAAE